MRTATGTTTITTAKAASTLKALSMRNCIVPCSIMSTFCRSELMRLITRPDGVVSSQDIGARNTARMAPSWSAREARSEAMRKMACRMNTLRAVASRRVA